jgi:hypothetical protein
LTISCLEIKSEQPFFDGPGSTGNKREPAMLKKYSVMLLVLGFSIALTSCTELRTEAPQTVDFQKAIPLEYGSLVAVTSHPETGWTTLWFEKPDQTVVAVGVNVKRGKIGLVATIPRK